ncbi:hypothetical protein Cgig2_021167 [Carnegiea gigantea]|uniref:PB1-like domain-containing protein n=1 Tax=Carnegiea gigantea TaxID=171969 RepID=A0A9Q1KVK0_9CARY|nr:hypothetical protein Cgig2_021167 [Carnegiea gigantea]
MTDKARKDIPVGGPDDVTLEINYGGVFEKGESSLEYKGGENRTVWPVDADMLSYFEVKGLAEDVGFTSIEDVYYALKTYYDSLDMTECARTAKQIRAYIIHKMDEPVVIPPALPSCESDKETYTSKQPKNADGKRVKHVANKRTSPRGKAPLQMLEFQTQDKRHHLKAALVKAHSTETNSPSKGPVVAYASSQKEKGPPPATESTSPKQRIPLGSASPVPTKAQQQFTNEFEDDRPDSPIPWDVLVGGSVSGYYGTKDVDCNEDASSKDKRKRKYNDAIERNDDDVLKIEDDILEDELHNVENIETSDEEWEVTINNLRKFKRHREAEAQRAAPEQNSKVPTTCGNASEYEESDADLDTPPTTNEEENMVLSRRNKKKRVKIDEHIDFKKLK